MTLTGTNFTTVTKVTVGGTTATIVSRTSATKIKVTVPSKGAGADAVVVTALGGTSTNTHTFTYVAAPTIIERDTGPGKASGRTTVQITGTNFKTVVATGVKCRRHAAATFTVTTPTQITVTAGRDRRHGSQSTVTRLPGAHRQTLTTFTYVGAPTVTKVTPAKGKATAAHTVTLTGTNFTTVTKVTVGGTTATIVSRTSATKIKVTVPSKPVGADPVVVTALGGTSTNTHTFTYVATSRRSPRSHRPRARPQPPTQ